MLSALPHVAVATADYWYSELQKLEYDQHEISLYGRKVLEPRTRLHFGNEGTVYTYSGTVNRGTGYALVPTTDHQGRAPVVRSRDSSRVQLRARQLLSRRDGQYQAARR